MKYLILLLLTHYQLSCLGQTIQKFLVNDYRIIDTTISEIVETKTYYENSEVSTYKRTHYYNSKGFLTKIIGLDTEGKLSTRMSYEYDNYDNLIKIKDEKWNNSIGHSLITTNFYFDSLDLKEIEIIGSDGELESKSVVKTEKGYPIKITSYNSDNSLIGYEIGVYNYDTNEVVIKVYNSQGTMFGKAIHLKLNLSNLIDFKEDGVVKNEFGDIIQEIKPQCLSCEDLMTINYKYKYDDNNNWISRITYEVIDGKSVKVLKINRKIKYATKHME